MAVNARDFGWWIESTNELVYGPVNRDTLQRYLREGVITTNTSVRHCTEPRARPVADQPGITDGVVPSGTARTGDRVEENWPRPKKEQIELARADVECVNHRRPAVLTCIRCRAPYCQKCMMKKKKGKTYFMCRKCQTSLYNRRFVAYLTDALVITTLPVYGIGIPLTLATGVDPGIAINGLSAFATVGFLLRDAIFKGAGPGKRMLGLRVVEQGDGTTAVTYGKAFLRSLAHLIPIFNLIDGSVPYADPFQRRYGDKWAKTRVIETERKLQSVRRKATAKLAKKNAEFDAGDIMSVSEFAQIDG